MALLALLWALTAASAHSFSVKHPPRSAINSFHMVLHALLIGTVWLDQSDGPVTGVWLPHPQVHQDLVELLHPQVPLVLSVCTQPVPVGQTTVLGYLQTQACEGAYGRGQRWWTLTWWHTWCPGTGWPVSPCRPPSADAPWWARTCWAGHRTPCWRAPPSCWCSLPGWYGRWDAGGETSGDA